MKVKSRMLGRHKGHNDVKLVLFLAGLAFSLIFFSKWIFAN